MHGESSYQPMKVSLEPSGPKEGEIRKMRIGYWHWQDLLGT